MTTAHRLALLVLPFMLGLTACESSTAGPGGDEPLAVRARDTTFALSPAVFDIDATPAGTILVAENATVKEIRETGIVELIEVPTIPGVAVNGIEAIGRGNFFATSAGLDLAEGAGLWRVSPGGARLVADIEAFERNFDPDANVGPGWKDPRCEESDAFSAGPQSNPYHLAVLSGHATLIADAAGNTLLHATTDGRIETVAVFTPPVDESTGEGQVLFELSDGTPCFVQPVPTSVDVGPDGAYYVGELTGYPAVPGTSRVWRIEPGSRGVTCPSDACVHVLSGLTSVIDVEFGPDGFLYVVEMDANGWYQALQGDPPDPAGGTVQRCDVASGDCVTVEEGLDLPGAITFDERGTLWLLQSGILSPTVEAILP